MIYSYHGCQWLSAIKSKNSKCLSPRGQDLMMDKKEQMQMTTDREASFGGCEYRQDYEKIVTRGSKSAFPTLRISLQLVCMVFLFAAVVLFTFACMYRYHVYLKNDKTTAVFAERSDIAKTSIQHTFIEYQTNMKFEEVDNEESELYSIPAGVRVKSISSESGEYAAGFREGDIIVGFNGRKISCIDNLWDLMSVCENNDRVEYQVFRRNEYLTFSLNLSKE